MQTLPAELVTFKNKQLLCYCHRQKRESEACINTSSLYHPPTYCRTHSLTPSLSHKHTLFPFLLQDTHLHRIIRLAAGDLAPLTGPVCGGDWIGALGCCCCTVQAGLLCDWCSWKFTVHLQYNDLSHRWHPSRCVLSVFLSLFSLPVPITDLLILVFLAASILHKYTHTRTHTHTYKHSQFHLPVVNYSWRGGRLTPAGW